MIVLGINENHNASAAIVKNGGVAACASEERFSRAKNDIGYPKQAIEFVLQKARVRPQDCDRVVYATTTIEPNDPVLYKIKQITKFTVADYVREMHEHWRPLLIEKKVSTFWQDIHKEARFNNVQGVHYDFSFLEKLPQERWAAAFQQERRDTVTRHIGISGEKISFIDHHTAHAYYAYFSSPVDRTKKTAVVTADSWGDGCNATISVARQDTIKEIYRTPMCNLARLYRWITLILGLKPNEHEYKVMGLAPYAQDYIKRPAYQILKETLAVDGLDFKWKKKPADMYFYFKERFEQAGVRFDGIAGGLQQWVEEMCVEWVTNILKETGVEQLVFGGGLAMNVKVNKALSELPQLRDFFVPLSAGDESLAMGSAFVICVGKDRILPLEDAYLGSVPEQGEVEDALLQYQAETRFTVVRRPSAEDVAGFLAAGYVIGRCAGAMEFGARALGNRSILCDPSKQENVRKINEKIKFRDFWMPFTPTILAERAGDYIVNPQNLKAPFMTVAFASTPIARKQLKAAVHPYDFTIRPQVLDKETNPPYYAIIKAFEKKTGIGGILNTSLNLHGEPIVRTAWDALHTFVDSGLDGLLLPDVLLLKKDKRNVKV